MKRFNIIILSFLVICLIQCSEEPVSSNNNYSVTGKVLFKGNPSDGVEVSILGTDLKTVTNNDGIFTINEIPNGDQKLMIYKSLSESRFSQRTIEVNMNMDQILGDLFLPEEITLLLPQVVEDDYLILKWSHNRTNDLWGYKIYQHTSSEINEESGTLLNLTSDTSFSVSNLAPLTNYYFRIYAFNNFGLLGGSNIVTIKTNNYQIVKNGSFENLNPLTGMPYEWLTFPSPYGYYYVDNKIVQDGIYSIRVENSTYANNYYQLINLNDLIPNKQYKLSYWIRHDSLLTHYDKIEVFINTTKIDSIKGSKPEADWELHEYTFTFTQVDTTELNLDFYFFNTGVNKKIWLDNVSIIQVE